MLIKLITLVMLVILMLISTNNHMFRRAIWDKLPECILVNFEIARVKRE